jgi:predicted RNA-binding Zn-ribbon protein involved in translation (DUF1610 family)
MSAPSIDTTPPKATLICPSCDHTSPPDGDWQLQRRARTTVYRCPRCGIDVIERPSARRWPTLSEQCVALTTLVTAFWSGYLRSLHRLLD